MAGVGPEPPQPLLRLFGLTAGLAPPRAPSATPGLAPPRDRIWTWSHRRSSG